MYLNNESNYTTDYSLFISHRILMVCIATYDDHHVTFLCTFSVIFEVFLNLNEPLCMTTETQK